jgi:hypothetical protein
VNPRPATHQAQHSRNHCKHWSRYC